tara:strand:+ start:345 stop:512 length:168 start_codon:yes stop_codon:yes gene_type:complete
MTLRTLIILGVIEQIIVFAYILPTSGWWFSFFGISALWTLIASLFDNSSQEMSEK